MQKTKLIKKLSAILCVVLVAAMALFVTGCKDNKTTEGQAEENITPQIANANIVLGTGAVTFDLSIVDVNGKETHYTINTDQKTVGGALSELNMIDGEMGPYGLYVKTVNGIMADYDTSGKYWAFYIDGEYATSGVEKTNITPGATYSFRIE